MNANSSLIRNREKRLWHNFRVRRDNKDVSFKILKSLEKNIINLRGLENCNLCIKFFIKNKLFRGRVGKYLLSSDWLIRISNKSNGKKIYFKKFFQNSSPKLRRSKKNVVHR